MSSPKDVLHTIPVVHKTLDIIRTIALGANRDDLTVKTLAAETGVPSITCYRILRTLIAHDWVRQVDKGSHELSQGLLALVKQGQGFDELIFASLPELAKLSRKIELTVKVSVRQGDKAVTICRTESPRETSVAVRQWATFPLAYGSSGAVLLSNLAKDEVMELLKKMPAVCWKHQSRNDVHERITRVRSHGWCVDAGTYNPGHFAISVPILSRNHECIAALTAIGFPDDLKPSRQAGVKAELQATSLRITKHLPASHRSNV